MQSLSFKLHIMSPPLSFQCTKYAFSFI